MSRDRFRLVTALVLYYSRLIVPTALFVAWLCYLAYLAATQTNPVVVSRSQMMASTHFVVARVQVDPQTGVPNRDVTIVEDLRPAGVALVGEIKIENIRAGRIGGGKEFREDVAYFLPLTATGNGTYALTVQPRSPGQEAINYDSVRPWAYVWDAPGVKEQFEALVPKR
jgi:hypothetical protein